MCLIIGPSSVGKTLLMKRLQAGQLSNESISDCPATIPTVGTNLVQIQLQRRQEVTVRELGGSMGPLWAKYFQDCHAIMYMVDVANRLQVSAALMQLLSILSHPHTHSQPVLLIFNKADLPMAMNKAEQETLFRLSEVLSHASQQITVLETSARTGQGLQEVLRWLQDNHKG